MWSHPSLVVAGARAAIVQMFHPPTAAGVAHHSVYAGDFHGRLRRTAHYFATVTLGDARSAIEASERLRRVHGRVSVIEPLTGRRYRAADPANQLWVHVTGWHSALYAYERYGPGRLSSQDEARYWTECGIASELQDLDPANVPGSRAAVREYFEAMRQCLCVSEPARAIMHSLLAPPVSWELAPFVPLLPVLAAATTAPSPATCAGSAASISRPWSTRACGPSCASPWRHSRCPSSSALLAALAPEAYAIAHDALSGPPPVRDEVLSPAEARRRLAQARPSRDAGVRHRPAARNRSGRPIK